MRNRDGDGLCAEINPPEALDATPLLDLVLVHMVNDHVVVGRIKGCEQASLPALDLRD